MKRCPLALLCVLAAAVVEPMPARADSWLVLPPLDFVALGDLVLSKSTTLPVSSPVVGTRPRGSTSLQTHAVLEQTGPGWWHGVPPRRRSGSARVFGDLRLT